MVLNVDELAEFVKDLQDNGVKTVWASMRFFSYETFLELEDFSNGGFIVQVPECAVTEYVPEYFNDEIPF